MYERVGQTHKCLSQCVPSLQGAQHCSVLVAKCERALALQWPICLLPISNWSHCLSLSSSWFIIVHHPPSLNGGTYLLVWATLPCKECDCFSPALPWSPDAWAQVELPLEPAEQPAGSSATTCSFMRRKAEGETVKMVVKTHWNCPHF